MGLQTAISLAHSNARVILGCRNTHAGSKAVTQIIRETRNNEVASYDLDLASFDSIKNFASILNQKEQKIDILVNNAGVFLPLRRTSDDIEIHLGVNYLGHFLLTNLQSPSARIVNVGPPFFYDQFQ